MKGQETVPKMGDVRMELNHVGSGNLVLGVGYEVRSENIWQWVCVLLCGSLDCEALVGLALEPGLLPPNVETV